MIIHGQPQIYIKESEKACRKTNIVRSIAHIQIYTESMSTLVPSNLNYDKWETKCARKNDDVHK